MATTEFRRQLSAIMFSDIVGYSKMMSENEDRTLRLLEEHNQIVVTTILEHGGKVLKFIGDAVVAMYDTASSAVQAASEIQRRLAARNAAKPADEQVVIRIGVHVGEVSMKDGDVFGNGVNIAARLEPLADHGGICVSEAVHDMLRGHRNIRLESMGRKHLKNIEGDVELYRVVLDDRPIVPRAGAPPPLPDLGEPQGPPPWTFAALIVALIVAGGLTYLRLQRRTQLAPDHPGFVVLVTRLYAPDPRAQKQADTLRDLIIQKLNQQFGGVESVKILPSDDAPPPRTHDQAREYGRPKGADLVVWGSASVLNEQVRIEPYITVVRGSGDVKAVGAQPLEASLESPDELSLQSLTANEIGDLALLGASQYFASRDPARAYTLLNSMEKPTTDSLVALAHIAARQEKWAEAEGLLEKVLKMDPRKFTAASYLGYIYYEQDRYDDAFKVEQKAKQLDPSSPWSYITLSRVYMSRGQREKAVAELQHALDANPDSAWPRYSLGQLFYEMGRYEDALRELKTASERLPDVSSATLYVYVTLRKLGRAAEAKKLLDDAAVHFAPNKFWATPILKFYAGQLAASELLDANADKGGFKRCRTLYYIGLYDLWEGKTKEGKELLQDLEKNCKKEWFYQRAAKQELAGLPAVKSN